MKNPNTSPRALAAGLLAIALIVGVLAGIAVDRLILLPSGAIAAEVDRAEPEGRPGPGGPGRPGQPRADDRYLEFLTRELALTAEQRAEIELLLQDQQERVEEISLQMRPQFHAIAQETRSAVLDVLNPEQRERLAELRARRDRERGGARHGDGPPGGPGGQTRGDRQ